MDKIEGFPENFIDLSLFNRMYYDIIRKVLSL